MPSENKDTILMKEENGTVVHTFCTAQEGRAELDSIKAAKRGGSMFTVDFMDAKLVYDVSPGVRDRIQEAKDKLRSDLRIEAAMERHGVPKDDATRLAVTRVVKEMMAA